MLIIGLVTFFDDLKILLLINQLNPMSDEPILNTIDRALDDCKSRISSHKTSGRIVLALILITLFTFGYLFREYYYSKGTTAKNLNESIDKMMPIGNQFAEDVKVAQNALDKISTMPSSDPDKQLFKASRDSSNALTKRFKNSTASLDSLQRDLAQTSSDLGQSSAEFILYGIFLLIFGVLTSFYRYFLKETSKYEHYLFAMHRIRIAANNYENGFGGEVRTALTSNAFESGEIGSGLFKKRPSKIESPIPGYPTADVTAMLLNKILDSMEITTKTKKSP